MARLKGGDMRALEALYMRYGNMVQAAIRRTVPRMNNADVEELTQDTFIALVQSAEGYAAGRRLKPWLYGIAVHKAAGKHRMDWRRRRLLDARTAGVQHAAPPVQDAPGAFPEHRRDLTNAFAALPREYFEVMVLHAVEGFRGEEIADILGIELNTVWTRLHRARRALMAQLKGDAP